MFPHVVSVFNTWEDENDLKTYTNVTVLRGVLLEMTKGANVLKSGLKDADQATLYIPLGVSAEAPSGAQRRFVSPKEFARAEDKSGLWTLDEGGTSNSTSTYFVKGEVTEPLRLAELVNKYDYAFDVSSVDVYDFGGLQHWRVGGK